MLGDGPAQRFHALMGHGLQQLIAKIQQHLPLQAAPNAEGEFGADVGGQIHQIGCGRHGRRCRCDRRGRQRLHRFHKIAHFFSCADVALGSQLAVGGLHGDLAHFQMGRQGPLGGQFFSRRQLAAENVATNAAVERFIKGHIGRFFQFIGQHLCHLLPRIFRFSCCRCEPVRNDTVISKGCFPAPRSAAACHFPPIRWQACPQTDC